VAVGTLRAGVTRVARARLERMNTRKLKPADKLNSIQANIDSFSTSSSLDPMQAWEDGVSVLNETAQGADDQLGPCRYTTSDGQTFCLNVTAAECTDIPGTPGGDPCPQPTG